MRRSPPAFAPVPVLRHELVRELSINGIRFTESWHRASSTIATHAHRQATITLLLDGSFEEAYPLHRSVSCTAPALHIRPPGEPHRDRLGSQGAHNLVVEVGDGRLDGLREHTPLFDEIRELHDPLTLLIGAALHRELLDPRPSVLVLEGLALELLGRADRRAATRPPGWVARARDLLHDRFRESGLRIGDLAVELEIHPVQLARAFRRHFGLSPGEYLRRLRVEWAASQIRCTRLPLSRIALEAGFSDQSHMGRLLRKALGETPAALRARS